ncbi:MAG: hypothetical protein CL760_08925 [Chloroflexi bacterium]|nr:hypothetical protein [Chloroflexota bacterium]|tara:strand:- start:56333 stop:56917 length:585 start_codon:yes stop_codon:yes gene_type:complete
MITLKENKSNAPLFISFYNVVTKEKQNNIVKFDTVNELALGLVKEILTIDKKLSDVVVADLDFVLLANGDKKENLSTTQDFNHKMLLVPFSGWNINLSVVNRGRRTRLYFADKELMPDLADPDIDLYHVVKVPKNISKHVSKGKMIVSCSDEYAKIYHDSAYTIIDTVNKDELYENINVDFEKYDYFIAKEFVK